MSEHGDSLAAGRPSAAPDPPSFAQARSLKRALLDELRAGWEAGEPVRAEDLLPRWPGDPEADPDVASLLFEEYCQRCDHGEEPSREEYDQRFPKHRDSLAGLLEHHAVVRSISGGEARSGGGAALALPA